MKNHRNLSPAVRNVRRMEGNTPGLLAEVPQSSSGVDAKEQTTADRKQPGAQSSLRNSAQFLAIPAIPGTPSIIRASDEISWQSQIIARLAPVVAPRVLHHVTQRGNRR
jgi:hypothetical protein